ncbi:MAG TPA: class I tRNA ligase family protein [Polyangiaceae bacterium]|nr:class I tRNA ligase family protein [Polyangiaceae bacterium]
MVLPLTLLILSPVSSTTIPCRSTRRNGMVVDETGDKMSKVKGNTIDPLDLIHGADFEAVVQKALPTAPIAEALAAFKKAYPSTAQMGKGFAPYGADALRFTLCSYSPQAKRIALSPGRIEGFRKFCNKMYNAIRFALPYVAGGAQGTGETPSGELSLLVNRWILSRLGAAVEASTRGIENYRLDDGSGALYHFFWDELCDWYIEMAKLVFQAGTENEREELRRTLAQVLESSLRALHPYMPFITEELWQRLPRPASRPLSIALAPYPSARDGRTDATAEREMTIVMRAVSAARSVRSEHEVHPTARVPLELRTADAAVRELLVREARFIEFLVGTEGALTVAEPGGPRAPGTVVSVAGDVEVLVGLRGLVEPNKERERVQRRLKKVEKDITVLEKRLSNPSFVDNAPAEVVAEARDQRARLVGERARLNEALALASELE